ncbi:uncharacterized protein LOC116841545 [Odontomachus brunneus]|uniref:uncharacterized protein LOC116841545 n=1 Tax=Odontomachus brunneus TaxID=486640 RepID=UPI0013F24670|nr:uncharacterized protein LOC116841545 [Odontomachus brunneus]
MTSTYKFQVCISRQSPAEVRVRSIVRTLNQCQLFVRTSANQFRQIFTTKFATMEYWTIPLSIVLGALGFHYLFRTFHYFKRHSVIHISPLPIFGSMLPLIFRQISLAQFGNMLYTFKPKAKYFGLYATTQPIIFIRDPELIKEIFVKNFEIFPNRVGFSYINDPLFSKNLFSLQGQKWRDVRTMLSPAFTSSKMKTMFTLMLECAVDFAKALSEKSVNESNVDMKDAFTKYTNDVIATCAFGIKVNSMSDPTNKFYVYGKDATNFNGLRGLKFFIFGTFPTLTRLLGMKFISDKIGNFFRNAIKTTIDIRDKENITRPDMIQLMMDMRGKREAERELTIEEMTAQAFVFFLGGFETSSTAMSFIAQEIAANPDVQEKLRQEIDDALKNSTGKVSYETINHLEYLEAVINETLRMYPPIFMVERLSVKDYELPPTLPGEKPFILKKGIPVWAPVYSIQHDEKYYDDPEKFRPERFLGNNTYHNTPYFVPFGLGPRMCIANRFAMLEIKVLLFHVLARCDLKLSSKSTYPIKFSKSSATMTAEGGFCIQYLFQKFNYFKRQGVIHVPPVSITTAILSIALRRKTLVSLFRELYCFKPNAKYVGFYSLATPIVLLRDPELIKEALVKNFETFPNRRGFAEVNDPLFSKSLFSLKGQKWRNVRSLLSPAFTSSKMKTMYVLMSECAVDFGQFLSDLPADKADMDMKDAFTKFTTDVIATCAFGIKVDSMRNPTNKFYIYGKDATNFTGGFRVLNFMISTNFPRLGRLLGIKIMKDHVTKFFKDTVKSTIVARDTNNISRPDMIQLMMDMRGKREADKELDIDEMTAQAFIFFFGGFETNSTAMSFIAHEIAVNPDVQAKLRQEIDSVLDKSNGKVTYEAINRLEYLDAVINEVLRVYPPVGFVERICERNYELPPALPGEKSFTIKKGQLVWVPVISIHRDEKYYPDPEKFRPERFLDKNAYQNSACYLPFGLGPRMCIANRFALLEIKVLMFHLLARCELKPCAKTCLPMKFDRKNLFLSPEGGFWLNVQRRSNIHPKLRSVMPESDITNP